MKVKATIRFRDMEADKIREIGDIFSISEDRFKKLEMLGFVEKIKAKKKTQKEAAE